MNSIFFPKPLFIAVVVTLTLFIIVIGVGFRKDSTRIMHAVSWDRVKAYQYEKTPGLKRAEELGLTRSYQIEMPVPETDLILSIYEVWYNKEHVYFFYSFERTKGSFAKHLKDREAPVLSFRAFLPDSTEDTDTAGNASYPLNWPSWEGAQHQGKFHQRLAVAPFIEEDQVLVSRIEEIVLKQVLVQWGDHTYPLEDIRLPLHIDLTTGQNETVPLWHSE